MIYQIAIASYQRPNLKPLKLITTQAKPPPGDGIVRLLIKPYKAQGEAGRVPTYARFSRYLRVIPRRRMHREYRLSRLSSLALRRPPLSGVRCSVCGTSLRRVHTSGPGPGCHPGWSGVFSAEAGSAVYRHSWLCLPVSAADSRYIYRDRCI